MRLNCPLCGSRDIREFSYRGTSKLLDRPNQSADFHDYLHIRENNAGDNSELWHHVMGCSAWLQVERNTVNHEIKSTSLVKDGRS